MTTPAKGPTIDLMEALKASLRGETYTPVGFPRAANHNHIVLRADGLHCLHCGDHLPVTVPEKLESVRGVLNAFAVTHAFCDPAPTKPPVVGGAP